jgi:hypothetical protein
MPEDFFKLKRGDKANILKTIQRNVSGEIYGWNFDNNFPKALIEPSSFKNAQKKRWASTCNQASNLLRRQKELEYALCEFVIELRKNPISSDTMDLAIELSDEAFGDLPRVESLEEAATRNNQSHLQGLGLFPYEWKNSLIEIRGYTIKIDLLGENPKYRHLPMQMQAERYINYLKKPTSAKVHKKNSKRGLKPYALVDWFKLMHSRYIGETRSFRSFRAVNLGRQKVKFIPER